MLYLTHGYTGYGKNYNPNFCVVWLQLLRISMPKLLSNLVIVCAQKGVFTPGKDNGVLTVDALLLAAEFRMLKQ